MSNKPIDPLSMHRCPKCNSLMQEVDNYYIGGTATIPSGSTSVIKIADGSTDYYFECPNCGKRLLSSTQYIIY